MEITPEIKEKLEKLFDKYSSMGQDTSSYLDGLLHTKTLTYWDYIKLETLLSIQIPKTDIPDEKIFIIYHQITELYFQLIKMEINQLKDGEYLKAELWIKRLNRIVNYFRNLTFSFDVMIDGMDRDQFLAFRMALLPASGFQSVQYREIEIMSTDLRNLVNVKKRDQLKEDDIHGLYENIYWKSGNIELKTGNKTLTLTVFEEKYDQRLLELIKMSASMNINSMFMSSGREIRENQKIISLLKRLDLFGNVYWPLSHYKSAVRYLNRKPEVISATGGTNWQKYLPPNFQKLIFFPSLWSEEEKNNWGKSWVLDLFENEGSTPSWLKNID